MLIELSIVLVIIGLIIGGVLVGQDLIRFAGARAQMSQIEKYNSAVNAFRDKYGGLPGDIDNTIAMRFGFSSRSSNPGFGDDNGVIEGNACSSHGDNTDKNCTSGIVLDGETTLFWADLSVAHLVEGQYQGSLSGGIGWSQTGPPYSNVIPDAKIGRSNSVSVWSGGWVNGNGITAQNGVNYFVVQVINATGTGFQISSISSGLAVAEAAAIDTKMDDSLPCSGRIIAWGENTNGVQFASAGGNGNMNGDWCGPGWQGAESPDGTKCYDNGNDGTKSPAYTLSNAQAANCTLSFAFQ